MKSFTNPANSLSKKKFPRRVTVQIKVEKINYKNIFLLRKYISIEGKILPRRLTNLSSKQQRKMSRAIKIARIMGLLPFTRGIV
nr:ribosomal protein S18 [Ostreobium quekettii]